MIIKAILLDVDGTLTNSEKEIPPKTKEALKKVQESGVTLILASGRTTQGLAKYAKELDMDSHHGLLVAYNGAKVVDVQSGEELYSVSIPVNQAKEVLEHLKKFEARPVIDKGEYMYVNDVFDCMIHRNGEEKPWNVLQYESRGNHFKLCEKEDLADFVDFDVPKILTYGEPDYMKANWEAMSEPFQESLSCMFTAPFYFEFTAKGVDKSSAIEFIIDKLGISAAEAAAYGDAQNDATMLKQAGLGVAMGNAVEELKAIADEVTLSNEEEGIAVSLEKHFPELFSQVG